MLNKPEEHSDQWVTRAQKWLTLISQVNGFLDRDMTFSRWFKEFREESVGAWATVDAIEANPDLNVNEILKFV